VTATSLGRSGVDRRRLYTTVTPPRDWTDPLEDSPHFAGMNDVVVCGVVLDCLPGEDRFDSGSLLGAWLSTERGQRSDASVVDWFVDGTGFVPDLPCRSRRS